MDELAAYRQELLLAMEKVIPELYRLVDRMPSKDWHRKFGDDLHTPFYTLVHLWLVEAREYAINIRRIYTEDTPLLAAFDDQAWMDAHPRPKERPRNIVQDFATLRRQELDWLRQLPSAGWSREGRHPHWGVRTLQWWVEQQLDCSLQHISRLSRSFGT